MEQKKMLNFYFLQNQAIVREFILTNRNETKKELAKMYIYLLAGFENQFYIEPKEASQSQVIITNVKKQYIYNQILIDDLFFRGYLGAKLNQKNSADIFRYTSKSQEKASNFGQSWVITQPWNC